MGKRGSGTATPAGRRVQLGPFWLWYRSDRDDWQICWYDDGTGSGTRRTCRKSTGISGGRADQPPAAAQDALADHYAGWRKPEPEAIGDALVENCLADWLMEHVQPHLSDPTRYAQGVGHWLRFFADERRAGRLTRSPVVADINNSLVGRFVKMRQGEGVSPHTISRDVSALRNGLNWNWKNERIPSAPFIPDVKDKPEGRQEVYSPEQVAAILEAALAVPEREHVHLFTIAMLSSHARVEAVLGCDLDVQLQGNLIYWNPPGRQQTKKRRSITPVAPTFARWLEGRTGRLIQWKRGRWDGEGDDRKWVYDLLPAETLDRAFENTLVAAGVCEPALDEEGEPIWLPARAKLGETAPRPKIVGIGSPNTLRHTCSTEMHKRGVPEAQIDFAAGHRGDGTNKRHYRHLRPDYLAEFIAGVEDFWTEVGRFTTAHLRYQRDTKVVDFGARRSGAGAKNG